MTLPLRLPGRLTEDDYCEALLLSLGWRRFLPSIILGGPAWFFIAALLSEGPDRIRAKLELGALAAVLIALAIFLALPWRFRRTTRRVFARRKSLGYSQEITIEEDYLGLFFAERGSSTTPWDEFYTWKANDRMILIFTSRSAFHVLPRAWFPSEQTYGEFQQFLRKKIGRANRARG